MVNILWECIVTHLVCSLVTISFDDLNWSSSAFGCTVLFRSYFRGNAPTREGQRYSTFRWFSVPQVAFRRFSAWVTLNSYCDKYTTVKTGEIIFLKNHCPPFTLVTRYIVSEIAPEEGPTGESAPASLQSSRGSRHSSLELKSSKKVTYDENYPNRLFKGSEIGLF